MLSGVFRGHVAMTRPLLVQRSINNLSHNLDGLATTLPPVPPKPADEVLEPGTSPAATRALLRKLDGMSKSGKLAEEIGVGGLDHVFDDLFRRILTPRLLPTKVKSTLGLRQARGVVLYGPPGTGKTMVARTLSKLLTTRRPKLISGPEVFNNLLGSSEQKVRELFKPAEEEWKRKKESALLHVIIIDEIDALARSRGGAGGASSGDSGSSSGAHRDSVVNQLLAKIDGLEQQNNVLVIGTTNRLDMIDPALLRPGRLEINVNLGLPNEIGRLAILKAHTKKLREAGFLDDSAVNLLEALASEENTANFTGAELEGLVLSATSYATQRLLLSNSHGQDVDDDDDDDDDENEGLAPGAFLVTGADFIRARSEVQPVFGVDLASSSNSGNGGSLMSIDDSNDVNGNSSSKESQKKSKSAWLERDSEAWHSAVAATKAIATCGATSSSTSSGNTRSVSSLLLHGPSGVGKQTLMRSVLQQQYGGASSSSMEDDETSKTLSTSSLRVSSLYPMMRTLQPAKLLAMNSDDACAALSKAFHDASLSPGALIFAPNPDLLLVPSSGTDPTLSARSQRLLNLLLALLKEDSSGNSSSDGSSGRTLFVATASAPLDVLQSSGLLGTCDAASSGADGVKGQSSGLDWLVRVPGLNPQEVAKILAMHLEESAAQSPSSADNSSFRSYFPYEETPVGHLRSVLALAGRCAAVERGSSGGDTLPLTLPDLERAVAMSTRSGFAK